MRTPCWRMVVAVAVLSAFAGPTGAAERAKRAPLAMAAQSRDDQANRLLTRPQRHPYHL